MIAGGNDTASGLLAGSAVLLSEHPAQRRLLLDDPGLIPGAVEELLRMTSPVQGLSRTTTRASSCTGHGSRPAARSTCSTDPPIATTAEFGPSADDLDVTRTFRRMLAFGNGPHHCIGAAAARLQARVALEELLRVLPAFDTDRSRGQPRSRAVRPAVPIASAQRAGEASWTRRPVTAPGPMTRRWHQS